MGLLDVVWHVANLFVPALALGALAAALAKLLWRRELAAVAWQRLAANAAVANSAVVLCGLVAFGREGSMAVYGALVAASTFTLWWQGFGPGRR